VSSPRADGRRDRGDRGSFARILGETAIRGVPARAPAQPLHPAPSQGPGRRFVEGALAAENRVDTLLAAAARGKTFSPAELLALQSLVFRYAQTVEIVSRVADRVVGAVKQTLSAQV
jgi:hypothetical protein